MNINKEEMKTGVYKVFKKAFFENYESIYIIDAETNAFKCYHESDSYSSLKLETEGDDFFRETEKAIKAIFYEDREYVKKKLSKELLLSGLENEKYYSFVYRLMINGKELYHKCRALKDEIDGRTVIAIGIRNIDEAFRTDKSQAEEIAAMQLKEKNHLEAIMASASGYMEANITKDRIIEISPEMFAKGIFHGVGSPPTEACTYTEFEKRIVETLIVENREEYIKISSREFLTECFEKGEKRASVPFSIKTTSGKLRPCRKVFYLYRDDSTQDILSFIVVYDLTEQQRKEKELKEMENALQLSRIHNFTSQMQPHFLYNTLSSIQEILLDDPEYASELIGDFTTHLRSCIRIMSNDSAISFRQELENIRAYVNIEKMRFGDKLKIVYDLETEDFSILPLSIQPLVENAIRHGIYEKGEEGGTVTVLTREDKNSIKIIVKDDGVGFDVDAFKKRIETGSVDSTGLKSLIFRIENMLHGTVDIMSEKNVGTTITITIRKEKNR
ncbi:MAG: histidine kinase [Lachnospiraceae bacterium]|nr:histidine kinase [Lachnospiraceae bacterium]